MPRNSETVQDPAADPGADTRLPRELWILIVGSFIVAIGMGIVSPALPTFASSFDVGVTAASLIVSAFAFMRLVFAPASGKLVSWFGERPIYAWGIFIVGVSSTACAFAQSYWQLLVFRGLGGTGSTMFTVSALALLVRLAPPHLRGRASSLWASSFLLGSISGPLIGGVMIGYSLRLPFLLYGVALYLAAFVGWWMLRHSALAAPDRGSEAPEITVRQALGHRAYRAALLSNLSKGWVVQGVRLALVPLFVVEALRLPESMSGIALSVFAAGNAAVLIPAGRLADGRGRKPLIVAGLAVSAAGSVALGFSDSVAWLLVASLVAGIGAGLMNPAQSAAIADIVGAKSKGGPVLAAFQMTADVGAILGPVVAGVLADVLSFRAAFTATGLIAVLALLLWSVAPETLVRSRGAAGEGDGSEQQGTAAEAGFADTSSDASRAGRGTD
ncbi:putative MFS family arabinose efflux permease [Halopolyspora algeriensis]|uniref:Putative MFS family arabinose efflux permease n=1 Tax=Halopolyspora algeriensis TaxID=1500506 RepID=A0A368VMW2_9ACTN|nr:MFS transporter [Halopolyspora algeriensis]RCW42868.1 putative MFS family arabinose efflux permease [Halopolyspora algeriensis]TQM56662.1 putative MFS family arabinose efflux permease [Halopolyspora algeriensis]